MAKLTKRTIDALSPKATAYFAWDDELKGFGVRVSAKGKKSFVVQYRADGRQRRMKIGRYDPLTADEGRIEARKLLGEVAKGGNPAEEVASERRAPTVAEVADRFVRDHVNVRIKASTSRNYVAFMKYVVKPRWGVRKIADVTRADIVELHHSYRDKPYQANRMLSILSKFFNLTEVWGLRPDGSNPCRRIQKYPEAKRERFLAPNELARLGEVLAESEATGAETPYVIAAFRLLVLTGCRRSEIQFLKWDYVTPTHIMLPDSKTGARKVPLPRAAQMVLERLPRMPGNPYVICGALPGKAINEIEKPWRRIREKAGLGEVRIHDLRHTYASNAVMAGLSIAIVGKILGHTQAQTTMRYAHFADQPVQDAATLVASRLDHQLTVPPSPAPGPVWPRLVAISR